MRRPCWTLIGVVLLFASLTPAVAQQLRVETFRNREVASQEILVRFRGSSPAQRQAAAPPDSDIVARTAVGRDGVVRLRSRERNVEDLLRAYAGRADVEYAEPNYIWRAAEIPNDPFFPQQWALRNTGQQILSRTGTAGADIKAVEAWDVTEGSRGIVVGMLDTGIDYRHPDLAANIWSAPSAFSVTISGQVINCPAGSHGFNAILRNCDPLDDDGHGSNTAGVVGAAGNNAFGVTGVSRLTSLIGLKFLTSTGVGTTADAIAAIEFAVQVKSKFPATANVRVLNASWGGGENFSQALLDEINLAGSNGMLFVASAGNDNKNLDVNPDYPASYNAPNIIAVAATDSRDLKATFSSFGATSVDLGAPGVDIFSTDRTPFYQYGSGTSLSAPMVSGAAALVLSACPLATTALKANLLGSVDPVSSLAGLTVTGGRLNVNTAIRNCVGTLPPTFTLTALPRGQTIALGHLAEFSVSVPALNGFSSSISLSISNLPPGISADFSPQTLTGGTSTLTVTADGSVPNGNYTLNIVATGGGVTRNAAVVVTSGLPVECTLVVNSSEPTYSGKLSDSDAASIHRPSSFADYCMLDVQTENAATIKLSGTFDTYIYLLSSTGDVLKSNDTFPGGTAGFSVTLAPGTYILELTSSNPGEFGNYTLSVNLDFPTLTSISPTAGLQGTSVQLTLTGTNFVGSPFEVRVSSCAATVSNAAIVNPTTATATLNLPGGPGTCLVSVKTPAGTSGTRSFSVIPPPPMITNVSPGVGVQGQTIPITISGENFVGGVSVQWRLPDGSLQQLTMKSVSPAVITLDLTIPLFRDPGAYAFIVTNSGGSSNAFPFTVAAAQPVVTSITPPVGGPGLSNHVVILGTSFYEPFQISAGVEIEVTDKVRVSSTRLEATFTALPTAKLGNHEVIVATEAGGSIPVNYTLLPPPTITAITPQRAFLGLNTNISITGTNFVCATQGVIDGTGVSISDVSSGGSCPATSKTVLLSVASNAPVGPRNLSVSGPNGTSNAVTINIVPVPPIIQTVVPPYGAQGSSTVVAITASDLNLGPISVNVSGTGVQVTNQSVSGSTLTATLAIAGNATVGARNLTVTNSKGESDPVTFYVTPPTWPDLTVAQSLPSLLGTGFEETSVITVRNVGTKETTLPITVTATFQFDGVSVSTSSDGWTCSMSAARTATCTTPLSIAINSETALQLKIRMPSLSGFFQSVVEVSTVEDFNFANNKVTSTGQMVSPGAPRFVVAAGALLPGQQATLGITTTNPFPHDIVGTATLSFTSVPPGSAMDPAVQFVTGGQSVGYRIRAFATQADFDGAGGLIGPIGFQTGTLSGTLLFSGTWQTGTGPSQSFSTTAFVAQKAPTLNPITTEKTPNGLIASFTMFSASRQVFTLAFQFNTATPIRLSCGGLSLCSTSGSTVTFQVQSIFNTWYAGNPGFGSLATVRVPFTIDGTFTGTVSVTSTNETGSSNAVTFSIP